MNCKQVQGMLSAYLDRELSRQDMYDVRAHLSECPGCKAEHDSVSALKSLLGAMPTPEPSDDFESRLVANVLRGRQEDRFSDRRLKPRFNLFVFAGIAACSMAATLAFLTFASGHNEPARGMADKGIAFEIQRDQFYMNGGDPISAMPVISATEDARH